MDFSICIVSYECREKLRACLESIRANRPTVEHEVIVVDNGSTDGTVQMLEEDFYWVRTVRNPTNRGFSVALNQAVAVATGHVLMMLNPDTVVHHGALEGLLRFTLERPWIGAVGPKLIGPDGEVEMSCREFPTLMNALWDLTGLARTFSKSRVFGHFQMTWWDHAEPRAVDWLSGAALVFTKKAWDAVGPLDEGYFVIAAELDWQKRLARKGMERWYLPSAQITHCPERSRVGSATDDVIALHEAAFRYFRKHHGLLSALALRMLALATALPRAAWSAFRAAVASERHKWWSRARINLALAATALWPRPKAAPGRQARAHGS